jgi:hypothetical protein
LDTAKCFRYDTLILLIDGFGYGLTQYAADYSGTGNGLFAGDLSCFKADSPER